MSCSSSWRDAASMSASRTACSDRAAASPSAISRRRAGKPRTVSPPACCSTGCGNRKARSGKAGPGFPNRSCPAKMTICANDGTILRLTIFAYYEVWTARASAGLSGKALMSKTNWQRLTISSALVAAGSALAVPAGAQFFSDRANVPERARPQQVQLREFFPFQWWGGDRGGQNNPFFGQPARPPVDYSKAPPPHKQEAPLAATVLVIGDSLADWLGYGLEEALADTPEVGVVRKIKGSAGLIRYESRSDTPDWSQAAKELLASEKPNAVVVMLGLNDRQSLRERAAPRAGAQHNGNEPAPAAAPAQPANQTP